VRLTDALRSILALLAPLAITVFIVRLFTNSARLYLVRRQIGSVSLISNILRVLGGAIVIGTTFALVGVPIGPLLTVLAGSSIGLSLALREPLSNLFSGMTVLASNKIQPGDYVRLSSGQEGYVTDIRWADTCIRELSNNLVVIPNALMTSTIITNFHRPEPELSVLFDMGVPYDSDLTRVEQLVIAVGEEVHAEVSGGVPAFAPLVRFNAFGETSVRFTVILRARTFVDQFLLRHEFIKRLRERFAAEGLALPMPIQMLRLEPSVEETKVGATADEDDGRAS
jgi:small-conductance mechanosensitive channel